MAQLTDLEKVRRKRQRRHLVRNLLALSVLAGVVWCGMWAVQRAGELDLKTAYSDIKAEIATGSGYPVPLPGGKIVRLDAVDNVVMLLSDTNLYSYNASGRQMLNEQHGFINEGMVTAQDRMLLYDRGGSKLSLYSKSALLHTIATDYKIYTADLSLNGNYAVATSAREYVAHVKVYNRSNQDIFNWYSYQKPVVSVSLSDTKEEMMVGCIDAADGKYLSSISRFQFSINQELSKVEFPDELLLSVDYYAANRVRALTDQRAVLLNQELKELASYDFNGQKLSRVAMSQNGLLVLVLGDFAEDKQLTVAVLDSSFDVLGQFTVHDEITAVQSDQNCVYLVLKNQLEVLKPDGIELIRKQINGIQNIHLAAGQLYYMTASELDCISVREMLEPAENSSKAKSSSDTRGFGRTGAQKDASGEEPQPSSATASSDSRSESSDSEQSEGVFDANSLIVKNS